MDSFVKMLAMLFNALQLRIWWRVAVFLLVRFIHHGWLFFCWKDIWQTNLLRMGKVCARRCGWRFCLAGYWVDWRQPADVNKLKKRFDMGFIGLIKYSAIADRRTRMLKSLKSVVSRTVASRGVCVCAGELDIIKLTKIPLIYSVSCFNFGGLELRLGSMPTKAPPWRRDWW